MQRLHECCDYYSQWKRALLQDLISSANSVISTSSTLSASATPAVPTKATAYTAYTASATPEVLYQLVEMSKVTLVQQLILYIIHRISYIFLKIKPFWAYFISVRIRYNKTNNKNINIKKIVVLTLFLFKDYLVNYWISHWD